MYQLPMTQIGIEMGLFREFADESDKKWTVTDLSKTLDVDRALLYRVLRYLASFGLVDESADGTYQANTTTQWLFTSGAEGGVKH